MNPKLLVIGGGWSGLTVASQLCSQSDVTLLEAAPQLGGRARAIQWNNHTLDNGQHLFLGAYHQTAALLKQVGVSVDQAFHQIPFEWRSHNQTTSIHFSLSRIKQLPWLSLKGLSFFEKIALLRALITFRKPLPLAWHRKTVAQYLKKYNQSNKLVQQFWRPLCEAALTTPLESAAMTVFHTVLHHAFGYALKDSDYWIPKHNLTVLFPEPAQRFIQKNGGKIHLNQRVQRLVFEGDRCAGAWTKDAFYTAEQIILATPYQQTALLLQPHTACSTLCESLNTLSAAWISTLYLRFEKAVSPPYPLFHLQAPAPFWVFDRTHCNQPEILALVFSQNHPLLQEEVALIEMALQGLRQIIGNLPNPVYTKLICEKRGAFEATLAAERHRPSLHTPISNVWLTGDYVANGYPACLEGAVINAMQCAHTIKQFCQLKQA